MKTLLIAFVLLCVQDRSAKEARVRSDLATLSAALGAYEVDTGRAPTTEQGLAALLTKPAGVNGWKGPYLDSKETPKDPWNRDYVFRSPGVKNASGYDLQSAGPDGKPYTPDDVTR